jgi:hypothetical protein
LKKDYSQKLRAHKPLHTVNSCLNRPFFNGCLCLERSATATNKKIVLRKRAMRHIINLLQETNTKKDKRLAQSKSETP